MRIQRLLMYLFRVFPVRNKVYLQVSKKQMWKSNKICLGV